MKKLLFILISAFIIMNSVNAQSIELVDANTYCNNPTKYHGKTITVKNVIIKSKSNTTPANINCKPPQGYKFVTIEFPNPTYLGCFVISQSLANSIISGRDTRITITFKSDINNVNTITQIQ
jgi:hypothetical protein